MSSDPDPHLPPPMDDAEDAVRHRFSTRFLGFAVLAKKKSSDKAVRIERQEFFKRVDADLARLQDEFARVPIGDFDEMTEDDRVAELERVFPGEPITAVPGSTNISINGVLEMDPTSLRQLAPHKRDELFAAAKLPNGSAEQIAALKEVSDKYRLRSEIDAANGKAYLESIAGDAQKATLERLYTEDPKNKAGAFRAFDISNKLKGLRETADRTKNKADIDKYKGAEEKHSAMLAMALSMDPGTLSEMVVNFEFAEMSFDTEVKSRADAIAKQEAEAKRDADALERREMLGRIDEIKRKNAEEERQVDALKTKLGDLLDKRFNELSSDEKQKVRDYRRRDKEMKKQKDIADSLTEDKIAEFESAPLLVEVTNAHKQAATKSFVAEMTGPESPERTETIEELNVTLTAYTAAVGETGNSGGKATVTQNLADVTLNAAEARKVAASLYFSDDKTAGYHTMKHHKAIEKDSSFTAHTRPNTVENEVAHYHDRARKAVATGDIVLSHIEQNGGEGHHFNDGSLTAIVKMAKDKAGIATYF